jgi:transcriptional/translational regulatory protein YebC/TACO1
MTKFVCNRKKFDDQSSAIDYANFLFSKTGVVHAVERAAKKKSQLKADAIELIIQEFEASGAEFTCLASFNSMRDYARKLAEQIYYDHGIMFSASTYFPLVNSGDNLQWWASTEYCTRLRNGGNR